MPRQARLDSPGPLHHIMIRGIERRRIVDDDVDRHDFIRRLGTLVEETRTPDLCLGADEQPCAPAPLQRGHGLGQVYETALDRIRRPLQSTPPPARTVVSRPL